MARFEIKSLTDGTDHFLFIGMRFDSEAQAIGVIELIRRVLEKELTDDDPEPGNSVSAVGFMIDDPDEDDDEDRIRIQR